LALRGGIQAFRLVLAGIFDHYPDLQLILGHWGEVVLFFLNRINMMPAEPRQATHLQWPISDYFMSKISVTPSGVLRFFESPKSVLLRLVAADGTEWDRKELKIADAFHYDEEQGQYTALSDLILHGWCEPKRAETPSAPCENPQNAGPSSWATARS
jgi:hypothetical protein